MRIISLDKGVSPTIIEGLGAYPGLRNLPREKLEEVATTGAVLQYEPGEPIVHHGDPSDSFFLLLQGTVAVHVVEEGERRELGRIEPPFSLGEVGCLLGKPRTATVTAAGRVLALRLKASVLRDMFDRIPGFGYAVATFLADRLDHVAGSVGPPDPEEERPLSVLILTTRD